MAKLLTVFKVSRENKFSYRSIESRICKTTRLEWAPCNVKDIIRGCAIYAAICYLDLAAQLIQEILISVEVSSVEQSPKRHYAHACFHN